MDFEPWVVAVWPQVRDLAGGPALPESAAMFALTTNATAEFANIVDER